MRILVTGGAGYIGSVMCRMLADSGHEVLVLDDLSNGHAEAIVDFKLARVNLLDLPALSEAVTRFAPQAVMNFASLILAGESVREPMKYFQTNISGALNLAAAMVNSGCKRLVFSSSAAVYGTPEITPIVEDAPTRPINAYGLSKMIFEKCLEWLDQAYDLKYISLRYFNASGADLNYDLGEDHNPETHLIPRVILTAMGKADTFEIYGTDYATPDGTCIRDYIHITDLCRAHLQALEALVEEQVSGIYNLGNGSGFSVKEVVEVVKKISGKDFPVTLKERRPGDPPVLVASSERARKALGWEPVSPGIEEIVASAWEWHTRHPEGYRS